MKKLMFVFLCIFAMTISHAYALDATFDSDTGVVSIRGTAQENESLAIVITNSEVDNLERATASLLESHGIGFYEANADEDGEYSLTFKVDNFEGPYNVFVSGAVTEEYAWLGEAQTCIQKFNIMINKVQVKELIGELQAEYGGDEEIYDKYFGLRSTDAIDRIVYVGKPYSSLAEVYEVFEDAVKNYNANSGGAGSNGTGGGITVIAPNVPGEVIPAGQTFVDVVPGFWGYEAIEELYAKGVVNGVGDNRFAPDKPITREEFVKLLVSLIGLETDGKEDTFVDTNKLAWYSPYLAVAQECGIAFGKADGSFGVGENLTRQDMAVLAARVLGTNQRAGDVEFTDAEEISNYARNSVDILCGLKVMNGVGDGSFAPKATATRAQAAVVIYEIAKLIK